MQRVAKPVWTFLLFMAWIKVVKMRAPLPPMACPMAMAPPFTFTLSWLKLKSSIADIKNLGGGEGGHITAGKFLEHFVDYPWIHLDIAGGAFLKEDYLYHTNVIHSYIWKHILM